MRAAIIVSSIVLSGCSTTELRLGDDVLVSSRPPFSKMGIANFERVVVTFPDGRVEETTILSGVAHDNSEGWGNVVGIAVESAIKSTKP